MHKQEEKPEWSEEVETPGRNVMLSEVALEVDSPAHVGGASAAAMPRPRIVIDPQAALIRDAKARGYEGDACPECGAMTMVRNGTCLKCVSCGSTSGCS